MAYTKPQVVAQNASTGSYAAGCPTTENSWSAHCRECERTEQSVSLTGRKFPSWFARREFAAAR